MKTLGVNLGPEIPCMCCFARSAVAAIESQAKRKWVLPTPPCNLRLTLTENPSSANLLILLDYLLY